MNKIAISSEKAPNAVGPYSQAILTSSKFELEVSGQIGINPKEGKLVIGGIGEQTDQAL